MSDLWIGLVCAGAVGMLVWCARREHSRHVEAMERIEAARGSAIRREASER